MRLTTKIVCLMEHKNLTDEHVAVKIVARIQPCLFIHIEVKRVKKTYEMRQNVIVTKRMILEDDMTYSLDLRFRKPPKGHHSRPLAQIYVKTHSSDENGYIFITPECVSLRNVEEQIDRLKKELETIRKKARRKFADAGEKVC